MLTADVRHGSGRRPSLSAMADRTAELGERMLVEVRERRMWREGLRQIGRELAAPFVAEMTGDAAVDHADLGIPDLADPGAETSRRSELVVLFQYLPEAALKRPVFGVEGAPSGDRHEYEKDQRRQHHPGKVLAFEFVLSRFHFRASAAWGARACRASRGASRVREQKFQS